MQRTSWKSSRLLGQALIRLVSLGMLGAVLFAAAAGAEEKPATGDVNSERARFIAAIKEINRWGPDARIVGDLTAELDKSIADGTNLVAYLGPGLIKEHQPYRLSWIKKTFTFGKFTPAEAAKEGIKEMEMTILHPD